MTITKKLLLIATISLGIPFNAFTNNICIDIKMGDEISTITNFMPVLHWHASFGADKIATWLHKKLKKESLKKQDAIAIAHIIQANTTIDTKIADILQIIAHKEERKQPRLSIKQKCTKIAEAALICGTCILLGALVIIDAAYNPYQPKSITTTQTVNYRNGSTRTFTRTNYMPYYPYYYNPEPNVHVTIRQRLF